MIDEPYCAICRDCVLLTPYRGEWWCEACIEQEEEYEHDEESTMNYQDEWQTIAQLVKRVETANQIVVEQNRLLGELFSRFVPEGEKPTVILSWDKEIQS